MAEIDARIPLMGQQMRLETPMESQAKAITLQEHVLDQQQKIRALRAQQAFGQAIQAAGGDVEKALPQLYAIDPMTAMGIHRQLTAEKQKSALGQMELAKGQRESQRATQEHFDFLTQRFGGILDAPEDQQAGLYQQMRTDWLNRGLMSEKDLPEQYDPQMLKATKAGLEKMKKAAPGGVHVVQGIQHPDTGEAGTGIVDSSGQLLNFFPGGKPPASSASAMDAEYQGILTKQNLGQELTPEETAKKQAYETRKSGSAAEDVDSLADMLYKGDILPSQMSRRSGAYNAAIARASRKSQENGGPPISPAKMQLEYDAAKRFVGTMNNQQNVNFNRLGSSIKSQIEEVQRLADELKQSGVQKWNSAKRSTIQQLWGNSPQSELANRYMTALNGLQSEMAQFESGGFAPQVGGWEVAKRQLNADYGLQDMTAALDEVGRQVGFRLKAQSEARPMMPGGGENRFAPPGPTAPTKAGGSGLFMGKDGELHSGSPDGPVVR